MCEMVIANVHNITDSAYEETVLQTYKIIGYKSHLQ